MKLTRFNMSHATWTHKLYNTKHHFQVYQKKKHHFQEQKKGCVWFCARYSQNLGFLELQDERGGQQVSTAELLVFRHNRGLVIAFNDIISLGYVPVKKIKSHYHGLLFSLLKK